MKDHFKLFRLFAPEPEKEAKYFPPHPWLLFHVFAMNMLHVTFRGVLQYVTTGYSFYSITCFIQKLNNQTENLFFGFLYKRLPVEKRKLLYD
ncbi:hypothetical protein CW304_21185 [Bacillus sp. UFRGS-B20]|nr:hypothetical protein CW304_21185 [Bacillus sp. UFRGS-B20]